MKTFAPLSKTQYGIYVECVQHLGEYCYNITYLYTLDVGLDEEKLKAAIESVVAAHPSLHALNWTNKANQCKASMTARRSAWR